MGRFRTLTKIRGKASFKASEKEDLFQERGGAEIVLPPSLKKDILGQFIGLRDALLNNKTVPRLRVLGVTSSRQKEGKTTISIFLASAFAIDMKRRVLLVDANLRNPTVHTFFRLPVSPGLSDVIQEEQLLNAGIVRIRDSSLSILPSGSVQGSPVELLALDTFNKRIEDLKRAFDIIIVDTPNAIQYPDITLIGKSLDGVLLVVEADSTQLSLIFEAKSRIESASIQILGVTLNRLKTESPSWLNRVIGLE